MRRRLLESLAESPDGMSIAAMTNRLPISRTAVNKHLAVLKGAGLVQHQRVGREARYQLAPEPLDRLRDWLTFFDGYWNQHLSALAQYVEKDDDAT
jgi:predicted ArsR family transcriptional regulator